MTKTNLYYFRLSKLERKIQIEDIIALTNSGQLRNDERAGTEFIVHVKIDFDDMFRCDRRVELFNHLQDL